MKKSVFVCLVVTMLILGMVFTAWAVDGSSWSQVGGTLPEDAAFDLSSLISINNVLYVGSDYGVWSWNGNTWSQVGGASGPTGIFCLASLNGILYAGTSEAGVWSWNGTTWSQVGGASGLTGNAANPINSLTSINNVLYAGTGAGVWSWDGNTWSQVGGSSNLTGNAATVTCLASLDGVLYAGTDSGVWSWNGNAWSQIGVSSDLTGNAAAVTCLASVNGVLYAGVSESGIWSWNGTTWLKIFLPSSIPDNHADDAVTSLANANGVLYAGTYNGIWTWNGTTWSHMEDGDQYAPSSLHSIILYFVNNTLYAGEASYGVMSLQIPFSNQQIKIIVNGNQLAPDVPPFMDSSNRIQIPFRSIGEALGCTVNWDNDTKQMTVQKQGIAIVMTIGQTKYTVNGVTKSMDTVPVIINGRTFIPLRALGEALNCTVNWDQSSQTVSVTSN